MNPAELQATLQRNLDLIKRDTAGISDEDALKRIGQGSSLNWVVGHVLSSRTRIMEFLGVEDSTFKHDDIRVLYGRDTQPDGANELPPPRPAPDAAGRDATGDLGRHWNC